MKLTCPSCEGVIPATDINIDTGIAKCVACNELLNVFERLGLHTPTGGALAPVEEPVPRPRSITVLEELPSTWSAQWRWLQPVHYFLLFFCIGWDGFLIVWSLIAVSSANICMLLFPVAHVAIGVGLTYMVIAAFLNRTTVRLDGGRLAIRHAPIYWKGNREIGVETLDQLYCKPGTWKQENATEPAEYELWAALTDGSTIKLVGVPTLAEARFLEQQIEARAGIVDRPMPLECKRS
jgi:hypothetical protein